MAHSGLGPPLALTVASEGSLGTQAAGDDARLWLPADQMYALRLAAGATALVGLAQAGSIEELLPLPQLFSSKYQATVAPPVSLPDSTGLIQQQQQEQQQLGGLLVAAELWPAQGLAKGTGALSPVLRGALARPDAGTRLLVFGAGEQAVASGKGGVSGSSSTGTDDNAARPQQQQPQQQCTHVYLRMCQQGGSDPGACSAAATDAGTTAATAGPPAPVLLPLDDAAAGAADSAGEAGVDAQLGGTPPGLGHAASFGVWAVQSPAMRGKGGAPVALSPAMRGKAAAPVALSPVMRGRGGGTAPVGLSPGGAKGRPGTPQGSTTSSTGVAAASTPPPPSSSSGRSSSSTGGGRLRQPPSQVSDRAKAEALLSMLLAEDPSPRVRGMIEALLLRELAGRRLLAGNLVALPVFGQQSLFAVEQVVPAVAPGAPGAPLPLPVTASTTIHLLLAGEAAAEAGEQLQQQRQQDWPALAAAAAVQALGCSPDDAGALAASHAAAAGLASRGITFDDLGGATMQARALREMVALPLQAPHLFAQYSITPPRGVLLYGPPGTGKTMLARATAALAGACFFVINGPEVVSEYFGESEAGLRGIFAAAAALAPSVVFIDELDAVAPSRDGASGNGKAVSNGGASARVITTLLTEMDALGGSAVVVLAATNRPDSLDPSLRRPGRFDREVEVGVPPPLERRDILAKQLRGMAHELTAEQVAELAENAHGFVAADLAALCNEAALIALRRMVAGSGTSAGACRITISDFKAAETRIRPSAMRELAFEVPKVSWDDIGGLEEVKQRIKEAVELPFAEPEAMQRLGVVPPRGILLHGPPGCSKTLLARAVASQARLNFISVKGPELFSKYVGESEKALAALFSKARTSSPCVVFFDEIDGLAMMRDNTGDNGVGVGERMLSQLLQEMDGLQSRCGVIVIAATNRPDCLDPALLRPGRFDRLVQVPPPDCAGRAAIFSVHTRFMPLAPDVRLASLAEQTCGLTGAAIAACCREAALCALEEDINTSHVAMQHFITSLASQRLRFQDTA